MLYIVKQIKKGILNLTEVNFQGGEGFQVFDGATGKADGKITQNDIYELSKRLYSLSDNTDDLMQELNSLSNKLSKGNVFKNTKESRDYFDSLVRKYKPLFDKVTFERDYVSNHIKQTSKEERKKDPLAVLNPKRKVRRNKLNKDFNHLEVASKRTTFEGTMNQIEKTRQSALNLKDQLKATKELNGNLEDYFFRDNAGFSIEAGLRKIFNKDKFSKILKIKEQYIKLLSESGAKDRLERAICSLTTQYKRTDGMNGLYDSPLTNTGKKVLSNVFKVLPWLFGIYLGDIPLLFLKKLAPGANINKSVTFKNWIKDGMPGEFENYHKANEKDANVLKNQFSLRNMLSSLKVSSREKKLILAGKLDQLSSTTLDLIRTYIKDRLVPDLRVLNTDSYNVFERGFLWIFKDAKYEKGKTIIKEILEDVKNGGTDLAIADKIIALLKEEGDTDTSYTEARQLYFKEVKKNSEIFDSISTLLKNEGLSVFKNIFYYDSIEDIKQLGASESDQRSLDRLEGLLNPVDIEGLRRFIKKNPSTMRFIKSLRNSKLRKKYLESTIPKNKKLKYIDVGSSKHGRNLSKYSNEEALRIAESETPKKGSKISTLGYAYRSLINKGNIFKISYSDFRTAFANKTTIPIDALGNDKIINTGRKEGQIKITDINKLKARGDKEVFKLAPITKHYSFYTAQGAKVDAKATFHVYMRPDCSNPLIVPGNVEITTSARIPEFENRTKVLVDGKFALVIPWTIFKKIWKKGTRTKKVQETKYKTETRTGYKTETRTGTRTVDNPTGSTTTNVRGGVDKATGGSAVDNSSTTSSSTTNGGGNFSSGQETSVSNTTTTGTTTNVSSGVSAPVKETFQYQVKVPYQYTVQVPYTVTKEIVETFTYSVGKSIGRKLAETFFASVAAGASQNLISQELVKCVKENNISKKELNSFIKKDLPKIYSKAKNLQKATTKPIAVPTENYNPNGVSKFEYKNSKDYYKVKKGDTLSAIAKIYGMNYKELARINGITAPYKINVGDKIFFKVNGKVNGQNNNLEPEPFSLEKNESDPELLGPQTTILENPLSKLKA